MPEEPNPYVPSKVATTHDEVAIVRKAREPVRHAVFAVLLLGVAFLPALFVGGFAGIIVGFIGASVLWWLYRFTTRTPKGISPAITAGNTACPACKSMQTDQAYMRAADGTEVLSWTCFACEHSWPVRDRGTAAKSR